MLFTTETIIKWYISHGFHRIMNTFTNIWETFKTLVSKFSHTSIDWLPNLIKLFSNTSKKMFPSSPTHPLLGYHNSIKSFFNMSKKTLFPWSSPTHPLICYGNHNLIKSFSNNEYIQKSPVSNFSQASVDLLL